MYYIFAYFVDFVLFGHLLALVQRYFEIFPLQEQEDRSWLFVGKLFYFCTTKTYSNVFYWRSITYSGSDQGCFVTKVKLWILCIASILCAFSISELFFVNTFKAATRKHTMVGQKYFNGERGKRTFERARIH